MITKQELLHLPIMETKRLVIRKLELTDLQDLFECSSNPEISKFTLWEAHTSIEASKDYLLKCLNQYSLGHAPVFGMILKDKNKLIGTIGFGSINLISKVAEFGYALHLDYWNQNITTEATLAILQFGFRTLKLERIFATCFTDNIASFRVMEKAGMSYEGLMRSYHEKNGIRIDVKIYGITQNDWVQNKPTDCELF